jgi:hypothetical protein
MTDESARYDDLESSVTPVHQQTDVERRAEYRIRTLIYGKLIVGDGLANPDCVVRNRSTGGAQVRVLRGEALPPNVGLLLITEGLLFHATVVWRRGDKIGLAFNGHHDLRHDDDPRLTAVHALWMDLVQSVRGVG